MSFNHVFDRAVHRASHKLFLFDDARELTYGEAHTAAANLAGALASRGVGYADRVGLYLPNSVDHVLAWLACWQIGALPVELNPDLPAEALAAQVGYSQPKVLLYEAAAADRVEAAHLQDVDVLIDDAGLADLLRTPSPGYERVDSGDAPSNFSFTSGTTGVPKGVVLPHGPVALTTACIAERMRIGLDDVVFCPGPLYSSFQLVANVFPAMHRAAACGLMRRWNPADGWSLIARRGVTHFVSYPMILADLVRHADQHGVPAGSLRVAMSGGSTTTHALKQRYRRILHIPLIESYGQSELGGFFAMGAPDDDLDAHHLATGRALPDKDVVILDADGREMPIRGIGEVCLRGGHMQGYWNNPQATAHALRDGWLHTGDLGWMDADGFIYQIGRAGTDSFDRGGEMVYPRYLEETLVGHPSVEHAAAFGVDGTDGQPVLTAYVSAWREAAIDTDELHRRARENLPASHLPVSIEILADMPRSPSGKLDKGPLRARARPLR